MAKDSNIVHQYFRNEAGETLILVRVNPIHYTATEITVASTGEKELREFELDEEFEKELKANGFLPAGAMEFNLFFSGLT